MSEALGYEEKKVDINVADIVVESSYTGPKFDDTKDITHDWVV